MILTAKPLLSDRKTSRFQNAPLNTSWDSMIIEEGLEKALSYVQTGREQNKELLEAILNTSPEGQTSATASISNGIN